MIPYAKHAITEADKQAVLAVLDSDYITRGQRTVALEFLLCHVSGAKHAIVVSSGTTALELAYTASGITAFRVPAITFMATANAARRVGCHVRFDECDPETGLTMGTNRPHAVYVTLGGQPAPEGWEGIVDACHGPIHHVPSALATVLSFHPVKHVCAGEGGAVLTNDTELATRVYALRDSGRLNGRGQAIGTNGHMDEMSAALAHSQLTRYHQGVAIRQALARSYDIGFAGLDTVRPVPHDPMSARHLYQVLVPLGEQQAFRERLKAKGIGTQVHYRPVPLEPVWDAECPPKAAEYSLRTVSLPLYPSLTIREQARVIDAVRECAP